MTSQFKLRTFPLGGMNAYTLRSLFIQNVYLFVDLFLHLQPCSVFFLLFSGEMSYLRLAEEKILGILLTLAVPSL